MALGNEIVLAPERRGVTDEGTIVGSGLKPGMLVQLDVSAGLDGNGRASYEAYSSGGALDNIVAVLLPMYEWGKDNEQAYADGDPCRVYHPVIGEHLNLRVAAATGTGDLISFGDLLAPDDGTGNIEVSATDYQFQAWEDFDPEPGTDLLHVQYIRSN